MLAQKLTVSRQQCIVQVDQGVATLTSLGRGATLWRNHAGQWCALQNGESLSLTDGDQISLDCNDPRSLFNPWSFWNGGKGSEEGRGWSDQVLFPHVLCVHAASVEWMSIVVLCTDATITS